MTVKVFTCQYYQADDASRFRPNHKPVEEQMQMWLDRERVVPTAVDINRSPVQNSQDGTGRIFVVTLVAVWMPESQWMAKQAEIQANAMALLEQRRARVDSLKPQQDETYDL